MKGLRSSRNLVKKLHRREKATIDHLVLALRKPTAEVNSPHSAFTASGLAVEDQIRKSRRPWPTGLAVF